MLSNFTHTNLNVAIIGASGGIGRALTNQIEALRNVKTIHAFSRSEFISDTPKTTAGFIDFKDESSIEAAAKAASKDTPIDITIIATGFLHNNQTTPEKALRDISAENFQKAFSINTIGPALCAKHFLQHIPKDRRTVFAALSARIGSIEDNRLGGWHAYRASKAALNMTLKNTAIETARRYKDAIVIGLHPGTVDTELSEPFQNNIAKEKLFTPAYSAKMLLKVINDVTPQDSGKTFAWDGSIIPY